MTLQDFFDFLSANPVWILAYFILVPFTALLAGYMGKGEGHLSPWKYLYSTLIYLVCIPGVFAITLSVYVFLFERRSIFETQIFTQILPILSMIATLLLIRRNVNLDQVPGFDRITGFITVMFAVFAVLWVLDKTHIWVVSFLPFWQGALIFFGLFLAMKWGWGKVSRQS